MPLLKRKPDLDHQYSRIDEGSADPTEIILEDDFLDGCESCEESTEEVLAGLDFRSRDADSDAVASAPDGSKEVTAPSEKEWSKKVLAPLERSKKVHATRSKKVLPRERQSLFNDAKTISKVSNFRLPSEMPGASSSVVASLPVTKSPLIASEAPQKPANDNLIPVWPLTGPDAKVFAAGWALVSSETPAVAFSFNLTPDAIAKGMDSPTTFLEDLKRSFDLELKGHAFGQALPYWFTVDIEDGRLHIHGGFPAPANNAGSALRWIRQAMKDGWGEWQGSGKRKQVRLQTMYDYGWANYSMRNRKAVAKIIGDRTFTISQPLRRDAKETYGIIREIMRATPN